MAEQPPRARMVYQSGQTEAVLEFLKRTRNELRMLRKVRVWPARLCVFDVNGDYFEVQGLGYENDEIVPVLEAVNTAFKPDQIHQPIHLPYKEFKTGKRYPWAQDRVM
jgi:hypothetical protein